jgi:hypothetical protein
MGLGLSSGFGSAFGPDGWEETRTEGGSSGMYTGWIATGAGTSTGSASVASAASEATRYWPRRKKNRTPLISKPADEI